MSCFSGDEFPVTGPGISVPVEMLFLPILKTPVRSMGARSRTQLLLAGAKGDVLPLDASGKM